MKRPSTRDRFPRTLWDLLRPLTKRPVREAPATTVVDPAPPARSRRAKAKTSSTPSMKDRYDELVAEMKRRHGIRVARWRSSTSGCAWQVHYRDGTMARLIESPYPRGPMSCAVFLPEVGHHAIGFGTYRPRCLEEFHAWRWSFETMIEYDLNLTEAVRRRRDEAIHYAVQKAMRRGLKRLPVDLLPFLEPPSPESPPFPALMDPVAVERPTEQPSRSTEASVSDVVRG